MNRIAIGLCLVALGLALAGCSTTDDRPSPTADYGPYPENYREVIEGWIQESFNPETVKNVEITEPVKGAVRPLIRTPGFIYGWRSFVTLTGQRREGGPVATTSLVLLLREGAVLHAEQTEKGRLPELVY